MTDTLTPEKRSRNMGAIRSRDTGPEVWLRKCLFALGYRYRIADKSIPGHPDIFLRRCNTAVFIHGCFWHRHNGCRYAYMPKSRIEFWTAKFNANVRRDMEVKEQLSNVGIRQAIIWECTVKKMRKSPNVRDEILKRLVNFFKDTGSDELEL
mgnify:FL=1